MDSNELKSIEEKIENDEYKLLKPLLEYIKMILMNKIYPLETIRELLDVTEKIKTNSEGNPSKYVEEMLLGFKQEKWNAENVNQASGDLYNNSVIFHFLENALPNLEEIQPVPSIPLPVMLFVMTRKEAEELSSGTAFNGYSKEFFKEFNDFKTILKDKYTDNWIEQYHKQREAWQPFLDSSNNIDQLLRDILENVDNLSRSVEPKFVPITINDNGNHRKGLNYLRIHPCVVIIDAISMRHPKIQREFRKSLLDVFNNTIVATIDPTKDKSNILKQRMIHFIELYQDLECSKRRHWDYDNKCGVISDNSDLGSLLVNPLKDLLKNEDNSQSSNFSGNLY